MVAVDLSGETTYMPGQVHDMGRVGEKPGTQNLFIFLQLPDDVRPFRYFETERRDATVLPYDLLCAEGGSEKPAVVGDE